MRKKFTYPLMKWHYTVNQREMPWKGEKDPYKIWLSEVILQQTRVEQGMDYYISFVKYYPTVQDLAMAKDSDVFKLWEGLGYYNRCKNLLFTARAIVKERDGFFPDKYEELLALKGVGPYTAAAIASFAYNLPYAVVDGNVFRVLARFFGQDAAIDSSKGKKIFTELAGKVLDPQKAGQYNQAIMDFGATVCKPFAPACTTCPLQKNCIAFIEGKQNELPVKEKIMHRKQRWFTYFLFEHRGKLLVNQRMQSDIWQNLFEFYLLETENRCDWDAKKIASLLHTQWGIGEATVMNISAVMVQQLTHQQIKGQFIRIKLSTIPTSFKNHQWYLIQQIRKLAFPKLIVQYLEKAFV